MEQLNIVFNNKHQDLFSEIKLVELFVNSNVEISLKPLSQEKGRVLSIQEGGTESDQDFLEAQIVNENTMFLMPIDELSYPLQDTLEIYAVLNSYLESRNNDNLLSQYLAIVGTKGRSELKHKLSNIDERNKWGSVTLAGFGPGDHWLLTRKAEYYLHRAEVIFYDDLVNEEYLRRFCAKKVNVGKRKGKHKFDQEKINELMYHEALKGKWIMRIKGGDPLIFGRGAEEYHYLQSRLIEAEIIPGISSAFASAAAAIVPFTERSLSSSVALLSGHDLYKIKIPKADTLVFYMGASNQQQLAEKIIAEGWDENTPVAVVHDVSNPKQQIYKGSLLKLYEVGSGLPSPSIIIVGKTAGGYVGNTKKWLYTGASLDEVKSTAQYVHTPLISMSSIVANQELNTIYKNLGAYQRIVFTSRYAVQYFFNVLFEQGLDVRALAGVCIDSIGKTTSRALRDKGLVVAPLSDQESSVYAMLQEYGKRRITGENVLVPGSNQSTGVLQKGLRRLGNRVKELQVYQVVKNKAIIKQNLRRLEGVVFTSPATVEAFFDTYGQLPDSTKVKCNGSQTRKALDKYLSQDAVAQKNVV